MGFFLLFQKDKKVPTIIPAEVKDPLKWICDRKRRTDLGINSPYVFATKCGKEYSLSAHLLLIVLYFILNSDQNDCFLFSVHA